MIDEKKNEAIEFATAAAYAILIEAYPDLEKILLPHRIIQKHIRKALIELLNNKHKVR